VAEHSVYVAAGARGREIGRLLLGALIDSSEAAGIWTLQSGIFRENVNSLALHANFGFIIVGRRERLGLMSYGPLAGQWRDVLFVERRSARI
jgi:phosphinothricin acetyltransferase